MSRRHHGSRPHRSGGPIRPTDPVRSRLDATAAAADGESRLIRPTPLADVAAPGSDGSPGPGPRLEPSRPEPSRSSDGRRVDPRHDGPAPVVDGAAPALDGAAPGFHGDPTAASNQPAAASIPPSGPAVPDVMVAGPMCTAPQLRRFIKSRPYVPMHELRRRFGINGGDDDVCPIDLGGARRIYVGLPGREGSLLGDLLRGGDIGYELSLDPRTPIVIGLYPMRPVART